MNTCSDCDKPTNRISAAVLAKGGPSREPGEMVCGSCQAKRTLMVRELAAIPNTLAAIKALRMPKVRRGAA